MDTVNPEPLTATEVSVDGLVTVRVLTQEEIDDLPKHTAPTVGAINALGDNADVQHAP